MACRESVDLDGGFLVESREQWVLCFGHGYGRHGEQSSLFILASPNLEGVSIYRSNCAPQIVSAEKLREWPTGNGVRTLPRSRDQQNPRHIPYLFP